MFAIVIYFSILIKERPYCFSLISCFQRFVH